MTARLDRPATRDGLFLWVMHRFAEVFEEHAIIKGGMALRLLDSPRHTMDIDYVFVPFSSKKEIVDRIDAVLHEVEGALISIELHSKMLSADLQVDGAAIKIEANVMTECEAIPMATGGFAHSVGHPSQVVRVLNPSHALAHKIAAWNERRLLRDLYDCYFLASRAGASPDLEVLDLRLANIQSRLPRLKKLRNMSRSQLADELRQAATDVSDTDLEHELVGILPPEELAGLDIRIRAAVEKITTRLLQDRSNGC
jgi:predicted nucleotidyltransferase component of viral defense system